MGWTFTRLPNEDRDPISDERQPDGNETPEKKKGLPSDIGNPFFLLAPWDGLEPPT
ncbi:hypothetical protein [Allochromatium vinosum]|uniref:hypothetical protein n=1 Tax=Allochromatium vinosum TaxID=1049 RepID=UPI0019037138|nr:hypothetical protein [Allochromatium vinosum]